MRNIRLIVEYEGTNYCGWQVQKRQNLEGRNQRSAKRAQKKSIQELLEQALKQILQEKIKVIGSGRTDSGVHARGQVANFRTKSKLPIDNIQKALNSLLPVDVRIKQIKDVPIDFHARFSAQSKTYRYTIVNDSFASPFLRRYSYLVKYPLNVNKMRQAAQYLLGRHNFRSFQAVDKKERDAVRTIRRLKIYNFSKTIVLEIEADGFLYRMARNIVGSLIEAGRGKLKPEQIKTMLLAGKRTFAGPCAPAQGLCLMEVKYKS